MVWYVVFCKPRQESVALLNLQRQGFHAYLPMMKTIRHKRNKPVSVLEPMFPRYLFCAPLDADHSIAPIRNTFGVSNLVRFGHTAATVRNELMDSIRQVEKSQNELDDAALAGFYADMLVEVMAGPLQGMQGLISAVGHERVAVLLEMLSRLVRVEVPISQVRAIHA